MANASMPRSGHTPLRNTGKVYLTLSRRLFRRLGVVLHRRARTDKVSVAGDIVDAADRRPVLVLQQPFQGEERLAAGIGVVPMPAAR